MDIVDKMGVESYTMARHYAAEELRRKGVEATDENISALVGQRYRQAVNELAATLLERTEGASRAQRSRECALRSGRATWERDYGNYRR